MTTEWVSFQTYQELQALKAQVAALSAGARLVGSITLFGGSTVPAGFLLCQGQTLAVSAYSELFAVIGTTYGSATAGTFKLPDLQSRFPQGSLAGGASIGTTGGSSTLSQVPAHSHSLTNNTAKVTSTDSGHTHESFSNIGGLGAIGTAIVSTDPTQVGKATSTGNASITSVVSGSTDSAGTADPISILPPYIVLNYVICFSTSTS